MYHGNQPELGGLFLISIILVIIECIPIIACPIIANNKGRSVFGWIMGGIFLGYIALIIIACLSSNFYEPPKITGYSLEASAILNAKKMQKNNKRQGNGNARVVIIKMMKSLCSVKNAVHLGKNNFNKM